MGEPDEWATAASTKDPQGWRPVARAPTYELVIEQVEERVLAGTLRVGDRLPPERELANMLGVSRAAVREAFRALQAQGVLRMSVGTGPDSGTTVAALPARALHRFLRLHVALANFPPADVVEARVMLERHSARLAASRASEAELVALDRLLDEMDDPETERDRFNELDTEFHLGLAEAAGNRLVADMTGAIRESLRKPLREAFHRLGGEWNDIVEQLRRDHHEIMRSVRSGNADEAERAVERHIRNIYRQLPTDLVP